MRQKTCNTCLYYLQHYALDQRKIFRVYCGHCTYQRPKRKRPDTKACENYTLAEPDENAFASKEYLSKALLEYMFNLDILPEIYDAEGTKRSTEKK